MECPVCDNRCTINVDTAAGGMSNRTYTWVVPDYMYYSATVEEMLARGCRVIKESETRRPPTFTGKVGIVEGVTIHTDIFHGD